MTDFPEIFVSLTSNQLKLPKKRLLRNGNVTDFVETDPGTQVELSNTCSFDVTCQIMAQAYIQYEEFRRLLDSNESFTA